ncbi:50S ribosomal protein L10, partial [Candidatus Micrarchaeota archaeon]|nr:50S ribosomal protein L10 [Candidatus Micrarchaeota archaeon]
AIIMSKKSPYSLNKFFRMNRKKVAAKPGQIAPFQIVVPASETDLPPGPALSELKSGGLNVQIKAGKIAIVKDSIVAKEGEIITTPKAKALQKLNILPFDVGVNLVFAYDGQYVYFPDVLSIDSDALNPQFTQSIRDAFNLSINASYPTSQNIEVLLKDAFLQGNNTSINAGFYSSNSIGQLLTLATRQGMAFESLNK